jgi:pimeloyl-ACP methyl ester carboxylesterase
MRFISSQWWTYDSESNEFIQCLPQYKITITGPRIALLVHGFQADWRMMQPLAHFLREFTFQNETRNAYMHYGNILAFNYSSTMYNIEQLAEQFANSIQPLLGNMQIELFAHSLGGIICRYALKDLGLIEYITRLVMLGSPNHGIPTGVVRTLTRLLRLAKYVALSYSPVLQELECGRLDQPHQEDASEFLQDLNRRRSRANRDSFASRADYYSIAGNAYHDLLTLPYSFGSSLGTLLHQIYAWMSRTTREHDGLVAVHSVHSPVLRDESYAWKLSLRSAIPHAATFSVNHGSMLGVNAKMVVPGQCFLDQAEFIDLPDCIEHQLQVWLQTWV